MEFLTLGLFCTALLVCVILDLSVLYALLSGLLLFCLYALKKGFSLKELSGMILEGMKTVSNILTVFLLIGILTALWRASGTLPCIVSFAARLIRPSFYLILTFLLNCAVSFLTGTSFGTAATMGVICAMIGRALSVDPRLIGGAVLSGVFFGDRCSPVSTSALLIAELTKTDIFDNIRRMVRSAAVPFSLSCLVYLIAGLRSSGGEIPDLQHLFSRAFDLSPAVLIPAVLLLALSLMHVNVRIAMAAGIISAVPFCLFLQHLSAGSLISAAVFGYRCADPSLSSLIDGGGIVSMIKVSFIVLISSTYSGIFKKTGLLAGIKNLIGKLAEKTNDFTAVLATSVFSCMISCNQSLACMLVCQLCGDVRKDKSDLAIDLEDTVIVIAPMIPWSIAGSVPLASAQAPHSAILFACYLYLLPLWRLIRSFIPRRRSDL